MQSKVLTADRDVVVSFHNLSGLRRLIIVVYEKMPEQNKILQRLCGQK